MSAIDLSDFYRVARRGVLATAASVSWLPLLLVRITAGVVFFSKGWASAHDAPTALSCVEVACALLVLLGLFARAAAAVLLLEPIFALVTKAAEIQGIRDLVAHEELTYLVLLVFIVVMGPGPLALGRRSSVENRRRTSA